MIIYFANHIDQQCVYSRQALHNAQREEMNPFGPLQGPQIPEQQLQELFNNLIRRELPLFRSIYFEENVNAAGRLYSVVNNNEWFGLIGQLVQAEYAAFQDNVNNPQADFVVGMNILFVDTALKYAIDRPVIAGDHDISKETRTLSACILSTLANNANCANFLRAVNAVVGCNIALDALDDSAENYVLKKKLRETIDRLNPQPVVEIIDIDMIG
jgi:hypothetical protein